MRLIELRGPDAADTHHHWQRRLRRWKRAARALWIALRPARKPRAPRELEFYVEAAAPEGAQVGALYADGRLTARLDGIDRL
jgi:hypothetical protein